MCSGVAGSERGIAPLLTVVDRSYGHAVGTAPRRSGQSAEQKGSVPGPAGSPAQLSERFASAQSVRGGEVDRLGAAVLFAL